MTITEKEIYSQPEALDQTFEYLIEQKEYIKETILNFKKTKIIFFGCGSSYMLAKTAKDLFNRDGKWQTFAIAGGDYIVSPQEYSEILKDSIVVFLTRSGLTTEILKAAKYISKNDDVDIISITMEEKNGLKEFSKINLIMPWAYDYSVCQTRTVTNFYVSLLLLHSFLNNNNDLITEIKEAIEYQKVFPKDFRKQAIKIAKQDFSNVIVLADGVLEGLAEEGSLVFTEIAMIRGQYFHLLDYRHGPKVLNDSTSLNIVILRPNEQNYQNAMVKDLKGMNSTLVTVSSEKVE